MIFMKQAKKKTVTYYSGLGVAYGTCIGTAVGIFKVESMPVFMFLGIAFGASIGTIYGKSKKPADTDKETGV